MDNNGCGLHLPCQHCGQLLGNHLLSCPRHEAHRTRYKHDTCPIKGMPIERTGGGFIDDSGPSLEGWIDKLEAAWLQKKRGELIDSGMKVEQARIHAQTQLAQAKADYFGGK